MIKFADTGEKITYLDGSAPTVEDAEKMAKASGRVVEVESEKDTVLSLYIERDPLMMLLRSKTMKTIIGILILSFTINAQMNVQGRVTCYNRGMGNINIYANSSWCNGVYEQRRGRTDREGYFSLSFPAQCTDLYVEAQDRHCVFIPEGWYFQFPNGAPSVINTANFSCR